MASAVERGFKNLRKILGGDFLRVFNHPLHEGFRGGEAQLYHALPHVGETLPLGLEIKLHQPGESRIGLQNGKPAGAKPGVERDFRLFHSSSNEPRGLVMDRAEALQPWGSGADLHGGKRKEIFLPNFAEDFRSEGLVRGEKFPDDGFEIQALIHAAALREAGDGERA